MQNVMRFDTALDEVHMRRCKKRTLGWTLGWSASAPAATTALSNHCTRERVDTAPKHGDVCSSSSREQLKQGSKQQLLLLLQLLLNRRKRDSHRSRQPCCMADAGPAERCPPVAWPRACRCRSWAQPAHEVTWLPGRRAAPGASPGWDPWHGASGALRPCPKGGALPGS